MAAIAGRWCSTPAQKCCAAMLRFSGPVAAKVVGAPSASCRLMWMCTPLPTPDASGIGENDARNPCRCAAARAISRVITAWSAAVSAGCGATVISNCRVPYSARNEFGHHAGDAQSGGEAFAERALAAKCVQAVGVAVAMLVAGVDEFLLERGDQPQA